MDSIGRIDAEKLGGAFGTLLTDDVVLTDERDAHIRDHHAEDYSLFRKHVLPAIQEPDEILADSKNKGTVFYIRHLPQTNLSIVIRLALENDSKKHKNSIITAYRIRTRNLKKLRERNKKLYNRE